MNLTYEISENKYVILKDGVAWIIQEDFFPYGGASLEEKAKAHIAGILESNLKEENTNDLYRRLQEQEQAIMELTALLVGGTTNV